MQLPDKTIRETPWPNVFLPIMENLLSFHICRYKKEGFADNGNSRVKKKLVSNEKKL